MHPDAVLDSIQKEHDMTAPTKTEHSDIDELPEIEGVVWLTQEEAHERFDAQARNLLGMSGEKFLRRLDAGEFDDQVDLPGPVGYLEMLSRIIR
jgi:hypothetical protein